MDNVVNLHSGNSEAMVGLRETIVKWQAHASDYLGLRGDEYWEDDVTAKLRSEYFQRAEGTWVEPTEMARKRVPVRVRGDVTEHP